MSEQFGRSDRYTIPEEPVAPRAVDDVDYEECPWLRDLVGPHATLDAASKVLASSKFFEDQERYSIDEDEQSTLMGELLAKRAEAALAGEADGLTDFTWTVRGGVWIASHTGMMSDLFRALAATSQARLWCEERAMPLIATFAVNLYGAEECMLMDVFCAPR